MQVAVVGALAAGATATRARAQIPGAGKSDLELPVTLTGPHVISQAPARPPPGKTVPAEGARIVMQIFVAPDGSALNPAFVSGAYEFTAAAAEPLKGWQFEPTHANTAPIYKAEQVMVLIKPAAAPVASPPDPRHPH
jgi:hypothetical protein